MIAMDAPERNAGKPPQSIDSLSNLNVPAGFVDKYESFTERAAIMQFDGGFDYRQATLFAFRQAFPDDYWALLYVLTDPQSGIAEYDAEMFLYEYLESTFAQLENPPQTLKNVSNFNVPAGIKELYQPGRKEGRVKRVGVDAVQHLVSAGIPIKEFYDKGADSNPANYSLDTPILSGKKYKVCLIGKILVLDIDRNHADGVDGLANIRRLFPAWLALQDIELNFPFVMATPSGGYHLYFRYEGPLINYKLCPGVEIKTTQISAGEKETGKYISIGNITDIKPLPGVIITRIREIGKAKADELIKIKAEQAKKRTKYGKSYSNYRKFEGETTWEKIIEFTEKDNHGDAGRDAFAYSLAIHARTHGWEKDNTRRELYTMQWNFNASFTQNQLDKCIDSAYK